MARLLSGRVKKTEPQNLPEDRYDYLRLADAQPDLGVPTTGTGDNMLVRRVDGQPPEWTPEPAGLTLSGQDNLITQKTSNVHNYVPTTSELEFGEIMVNTKDARLFYKRLNDSNEEEMYSLPEIGGNIDGGRPDSIYGGNVIIDGGSVTQ